MNLPQIFSLPSLGRSSKLSIAIGVALCFQFNSCDSVRFSSNSSMPNSGGTDLGAPDPGECVVGSGKICLPPEDCVNLNSCPGILTHQTEEIRAIVPKIDYFLVIDNSGSMRDENLALSQRLAHFTQMIESSGIDWQMCYTSTDVGDQNLARFWKVRNQNGQRVDSPYRVLRPAIQNLDPNFDLNDSFIQSVGQFTGNGSGNEQGIMAMENTLGNLSNTSCFRDDANTVYIVISDEDEKSCGGRCQTEGDEPAEILYQDDLQTGSCTGIQCYTKQFRALAAEDSPDFFINAFKSRWPNKKLAVHSLVIQSHLQTASRDIACFQAQDRQAVAFYGIEYEKLSDKTGGVVGSICSLDYSSELSDIATRDREILASLALKCRPVGPTPTVKFTPLQAGQKFTIQGDKIIFSPALTEGSKVEMSYYCAPAATK